MTNAPRPYTLLVDGMALRALRVDPVRRARRVSRVMSHAAVALVRLGDPSSLRRFEAGREVSS